MELFDENNEENLTLSSRLNDSTLVETYVPYELRPETYIVPVLFSMIFIVGFIGNGTLILIFVRHRTMRNVPNTYIMSLALADLLVIITVIPLITVVYVLDSWPWGQLLCSITEFFKDVSIGVSIFSLTALASNRYFAIVKPMRKFYAHGGRSISTIASTIVIWFIAILCGLPGLLVSEVKEFSVAPNVTFCVCYPYPERFGDSYPKTMVAFKFIAYFFLPLFVIGIFYALIALHLIHSARHMPGERQGAAQQMKTRKKVAMTVLTFVLLFGFCFLPIHIFMLWFYFYPDAKEVYNTFWHVFRIVGFSLSFLNSCANPVALCLVSAAFRKHFKRYLLCKTFPTQTNHSADFRQNSMSTTMMSRRLTTRRSINNLNNNKSSSDPRTSMVTFSTQLIEQDEGNSNTNYL